MRPVFQMPGGTPATTAATWAATPEFAWFGKLPAIGDFVSRRMPHPLLQFWDHLCASGMESLKAGSHATGWEVWRGCPKWAFLLPAQPGMALSQLGVLAPSCDRVGRNYPFVVTLPLPHDHLASLIAVAANLGLAWSEVIAQAQMARLGIEELDAQLQAALSTVLMNSSEVQDSEKTLPGGMNPSTLPWPDLTCTFDAHGSESYWWSVPPAMTRFRARAHMGALNGMLFLGLCEG